jgi:hypothetical protein
MKLHRNAVDCIESRQEQSGKSEVAEEMQEETSRGKSKEQRKDRGALHSLTTGKGICTRVWDQMNALRAEKFRGLRLI